MPASEAWSRPSIDDASSRTWTWENDIAQVGRHQVDLRNDSPLTLRSDGTGHFKTYIDNDDTFELHLIVYLSDGSTMRLPNALGGDSNYFKIPIQNRDFDFGWHRKEVLFQITRILITQGQ